MLHPPPGGRAVPGHDGAEVWGVDLEEQAAPLDPRPALGDPCHSGPYW